MITSSSRKSRNSRAGLRPAAPIVNRCAGNHPAPRPGRRRLRYARGTDQSFARKPNGLAIGERASETADLAISFGAVPNAHDRDFLRRYREDDPVLPNAEAEVTLPLPGECFEIAFAGFAILSQAVEDSKSDFAVDCAQIGSGRVRPNKIHRKPNSRRTSSCEVTLPARTSSRARAIAATSASVTGSSSGGADNAAGQA